MDNFIVSARKYRPATFQSVVGQNSITTTLKNAIKNKLLAHAYLFCGPRGVGKTTCARIFAKTINCKNLTEKVEPCNECESCKAFDQNRSYNIHELDAASNNSVDDIRNLIEQVRIPPQVGKYSIYIIDEVHMLSAQAFNAFLKTLEEPPAHAIFILATTEKHKIIPTILSRCQIFDFNRIKIDDTVTYLEHIAKTEGIQYEVDAFNVIAQKADGAMRDALSIFDQVVSFSGDNITYQKVIENLNVLDYEYFFKLTDAFFKNDLSTSLLTFNEILEKGFDAHHFISGLSEHFRNLLVVKDEITLQLLEVGANIREKYKEQTRSITTDFLFSALEISNKCDLNYRISRNKRLHVELALIELCNITNEKKNSDSIETEENPEKKETKTQTVDEPDQGWRTEKVIKKINEDVKKLDIPKVKLNHLPSFSIKDNLSGQSSQKIEDLSDNEVNGDINEVEPSYKDQSFSELELIDKWQQFSDKLGDRPRIFNTLTSKEPKLERETIVTFLIDNNLQEEMINDIRNELIAFLKVELKNKNIELKLVLNESTQESKLYTSEEKFRHLLSKNEDLGKLKQEFNLDFD
ncbi:MAG: DNA polymerase III, subunit gamma and tau [Bacteroidetes bacterium GWF2_33_16]|nr:MAG: DNA polymerase III, subunit gamma and tau [Bacteroidetes bacterium GWE2_32_14]OFY02273.1 MAG: DNA polymerase III, subunit gamma and tau [Bacteroidetes bacterium GWF2_33_16]